MLEEQEEEEEGLGDQTFMARIMQMLFQGQSPEAIQAQLQGRGLLKQKTKGQMQKQSIVKKLVEEHGCQSYFAEKVLKLTKNDVDKANQIITLSKTVRKTLRPIGYGYLNLTHEGSVKDCEEVKLHHAIFLQGEWKPDGKDTLFTGQLISCVDCNPLHRGFYNDHQFEECESEERIVQYFTTKLNFADYHDVQSVKTPDHEESKDCFDCNCDFHVPFNEGEVLILKTQMKNIGRKSMVYVHVKDRQKKAKQNFDLYDKEQDRFQIYASNFTECTDDHMHYTKNFYF